MKWFIEMIMELFKKKKKKEKEVTVPSENVTGVESTLFKPVSESRQRRAAVVVQCTIREVTKVTINGEEDVFEYRAGYANGNRSHTFLNLTGAKYPMNSVIRVWGDGKIWEGVWTDPSERKSLILKEVQ